MKPVLAAARRFLTPARGEAAARLVLAISAVAAAALLYLYVEPSPDLVVAFAGCDVVRDPGDDAGPRVGHAGVLCKVSPASVVQLAARGPQDPARPTVTLWAKTSRDAKLRVEVDGRRRESRQTPIEGGALMKVLVHPGAREITVIAEDGRAPALFHLPVEVPVLPDAASDQATLDHAMDLRGRGNAGEAAPIFEALARAAGPTVRAKAKGQLARMAIQSKGAEQATALFEEAMGLDRAAGLISDEYVDGFVFARVLIDEWHDLARADRVLAEIAPLLESFPQGRAMDPYVRALLASARGDLDTARRQLSATEELSHRLDLAGHLADVYEKQMEVLDSLGREDEAEGYKEILEELPLPGNPCVRAQRANDLAWHAILAHRIDGDTEDRLYRALALYSDSGSCSGEQIHVLTNLAHVALEAKQVEVADWYLEEAGREPRQAEAPVPNAVERMILAGRLEVARGQPDAALGHFREAQEISRAASLPRFEVEAGFGLAEALDGLDRAEDAAAAYEEADDRLNRWSALVPLGSGRQALLRRSEHEVARHLDFLVRKGLGAPPADRERWLGRAACVARRSRARILASAAWTARIASSAAAGSTAAWDEALKRYEAGQANLIREARAAYTTYQGQLRRAKLDDIRARAAPLAEALDRAAALVAGVPAVPACSELPAVGEGEVILVAHPLPDGWASFAITRQTIAFRRLSLDPETLDAWQTGLRPWRDEAVERLLQPFAGVLDDPTLRGVRLALAEPLGSFDLRDLTWRGGPLGDRVALSYAVDLPRRRPPPVAAAHRRALVVAIPDGDPPLPEVLEEATVVIDALKGQGFEAVPLLGPDATREAVRRELARAGLDVFYYAGHGAFEGSDGMASHLSLAGGEWLILADVMSLPEVPRWVLLSSCETADASAEAYVEGLGLAHAFVLQGAEWALAMRQRGSDDVASHLMTDLFTHDPGLLLSSPAAALRDATRRVHADPRWGRGALPELRVVVP